MIRSVLVALLCCFPGFANGEPSQAQQLVSALGLPEAEIPVSEHPRWSKTPRIVVLMPRRYEALAPDLESRLRAVAQGAELHFFRPSGSFEPNAAVVGDADVYLGMCYPSILRNAKKLVWLQNYAVGVERCTAVPGMSESDILLTNVQRVSAPTIAEHTIAMLLMLNRNLAALLSSPTRSTLGTRHLGSTGAHRPNREDHARRRLGRHWNRNSPPSPWTGHARGSDAK